MPEVQVVDIPGHESRRAVAWQFVPLARVVVVVVDAVRLEAEMRMLAELMFDLLTLDVVARQQLPIVVVCNKADIITAVRPQVVRARLEKEL
jgi:signal recognition particle receptor subunit beta